MRLPRPHIPLDVRCEVATRQVTEFGEWSNQLFPRRTPASDRLAILLAELRRRKSLPVNAKLHLDHDPALGAREKIIRDGAIVGYRPAANDPLYLVYRDEAAHRIKTNIRGEHGQHPDRVLIKRQRRSERPAKPRRESKRLRGPKLRSRSSWPPKGSRKFR